MIIFRLGFAEKIAHSDPKQGGLTVFAAGDYGGAGAEIYGDHPVAYVFFRVTSLPWRVKLDLGPAAAHRLFLLKKLPQSLADIVEV